MGLWDITFNAVAVKKVATITADAVVKTAIVTAGGAAVAGGLALTLVPVVGDAAGGALYGAGAAMIVQPIKQTFQGKELDFEDLGEKICKSAEFGCKTQIESGYESASLMPSYYNDDND